MFISYYWLLGKEAAVFSLLKANQRKQGTFKIEPSPTLELVKQFLPKLKQDNSRIQTEIETFPDNKSKFDIEHVEETTGPLIEMVKCFVFSQFFSLPHYNF